MSSMSLHIALDWQRGGGLPPGPGQVMRLLVTLAKEYKPEYDGKPSEKRPKYIEDVNGNPHFNVVPADIKPVRVTRKFLSERLDGASKSSITGWMNLLAGQPNRTRRNPDEDERTNPATAFTTLKTPMIEIVNQTGDWYDIRFNVRAVTPEERQAERRERPTSAATRALCFADVEWVACSQSIPARGARKPTGAPSSPGEAAQEADASSLSNEIDLSASQPLSVDPTQVATDIVDAEYQRSQGEASDASAQDHPAAASLPPTVASAFLEGVDSAPNRRLSAANCALAVDDGPSRRTGTEPVITDAHRAQVDTVLTRVFSEYPHQAFDVTADQRDAIAEHFALGLRLSEVGNAFADSVATAFYPGSGWPRFESACRLMLKEREVSDT